MSKYKCFDCGSVFGITANNLNQFQPSCPICNSKNIWNYETLNEQPIPPDMVLYKKDFFANVMLKI